MTGTGLQFLAIGLELLLVDGDDRDRIERDRLGRHKVFPSWRRQGDVSPENPETVPIMIVGPPRGKRGPAIRVILNPVSKASPVFRALVAGDVLVMELDDQPRGQATVIWVATVDRGLTKVQLDSLAHWNAGGATPTP